MDVLIILLLLFMSFLCGAIPTGYLLVRRWKHCDIREIGSGNIGSTNVGRAAGRWMSILTLIGDSLKGLVPVAITIVVVTRLDPAINHDIIISLAALAAIAGHDFTPFLRFHGGKGVNTTLGAFLLIALIPVISAVCVFFLLRLVTPLVSIRSLALGVSIPVLAGILHLPTVIVLASSAAAVLLVIRHKDNIKRLVAGTEL